MPERDSSLTPGSMRRARKKRRADGSILCVRYSRAVAREICERLAAGERWHRFCNTARMPSYHCLYKWRLRHPEFAEAYAQAMEMAADLHADRALDVAEEATPATVTSDRLHVSTLQWHAGKAAPERWGSKAEAAVVKEGGPRRLTIRIRQFERAWREDGTPYVREVLPSKDDERGDGR
jgi:hypothetical protein